MYERMLYYIVKLHVTETCWSAATPELKMAGGCTTRKTPDKVSSRLMISTAPHASFRNTQERIVVTASRVEEIIITSARGR